MYKERCLLNYVNYVKIGVCSLKVDKLKFKSIKLKFLIKTKLVYIKCQIVTSFEINYISVWNVCQESCFRHGATFITSELIHLLFVVLLVFLCIHCMRLRIKAAPRNGKCIRVCILTLCGGGKGGAMLFRSLLIHSSFLEEPETVDNLYDLWKKKL